MVMIPESWFIRIFRAKVCNREILILRNPLSWLVSSKHVSQKIVHSTKDAGVSNQVFTNGMIERGVSGVVILALSTSLIKLRSMWVNKLLLK
ncbi:MAG: hypothetical protein NVSMB49_17990 [Ktedonobacteraceae bacterium]